MGDAVSLVAGALRHKLALNGAASLTRVEWQMLRVSTLLHALANRSLLRLVSDAPLIELTGIAEGLDAIGAAEASTLLHYTAREVAAANAPGLGAARRATLVAVADRLRVALVPMRGGIEQMLVDFAFRQPELMPDDGESVIAAPQPA
jgi:hypothetical protein